VGCQPIPQAGPTLGGRRGCSGCCPLMLCPLLGADAHLGHLAQIRWPWRRTFHLASSFRAIDAGSTPKEHARYTDKRGDCGFAVAACQAAVPGGRRPSASRPWASRGELSRRPSGPPCRVPGRRRKVVIRSSRERKDGNRGTADRPETPSERDSCVANPSRVPRALGIGSLRSLGGRMAIAGHAQTGAISGRAQTGRRSPATYRLSRRYFLTDRGRKIATSSSGQATASSIALSEMNEPPPAPGFPNRSRVA
jgi:hypothetical protein